MARNGSGTYSLPEPAFVPNTPISSAAVNSDLGDIANALTGSIAADGQTTITAALKLDNSGVVYGSDPNTGIRRTAADTQAIFAGGVDTIRTTSTSVDILVPLTQNGAAILPTGVVVPYTTSFSVPSGWLKCDGSNVSRATYAALFAVVGTAFGSGDGNTTFGLPNSTGKAIVGVDSTGTTLPGFASMGSTGGVASQAITQAQLPNTTLAVNVGGSVSGTLNSTTTNICQGISTFAGQGGGASIPIPSSQGGISVSGSLGGSMAGSTAALGSGTAQPNVQPSLALIYIIKT